MNKEKKQKVITEAMFLGAQMHAIEFASFVSNDTTFDDFCFMSKEYQEMIYQEFISQNKDEEKTITMVEKEDIPSLDFPSEPVERTENQTKLLKYSLSRSMILGNIHRVKMKITFEDDESIKQVRTTIWAVGDKNIVLKKGITIPIERIIDIT